ncbi:MAG: FAD:protein FMN transferase [Gaiellaceae bacterium]
MGTDALIVVSADDLQLASREVGTLFANWEQTLSRFRDESELSALNRSAGTPFCTGELLFAVVSTALDAARASDGLFDPSLRPDLVRTGYDRSFEEVGRQVPEGNSAPLGGGRWRGVVLDRSSRAITLPPGCGLDLGGIPKGMAVNASFELLATLGIETALVSAGGDLAVRSPRQGERAWPVAVGEDGQEIVPLTSGALATSSSVRRRWQQGNKPRHHLLDPRTGEPTRSGLREVTVAAATCAQAEVAAKAIFVLGPTLGPAFAVRHGLAARLVCDDGRRIAAGAWPANQRLGA